MGPTGFDWTALSHSPEAIALTVLVAVVYPFLGYRRFLRIEHLPEPLPGGVKLRLYFNIVLSQWVMVALAAWILARAGGSLADAGLRAGTWSVTLGMGGLLLLGFGLLSTFTLRQLARAHAGDLPEHVRRAGKILPWNGRERAGFAGVALTAGICEEILYRGWLPWFLAGLVGNVLVGYAVAAAVFGLGHAYQGRVGVLFTGALGILLGAIAYATGSLLPGILLHIAIDLLNGNAVGRTMERIVGEEAAEHARRMAAMAAEAAARAAEAAAAAAAAGAATSAGEGGGQVDAAPPGPA